MLLLAADRLEVRLTRARRWIGFAAGALALLGGAPRDRGPVIASG
jgi:hypothetical protein